MSRAAVSLATGPRALAEDPPKAEPPPKTGAVLTDPALGITVEGPPNWTLAKDKVAVSTWGRCPCMCRTSRAVVSRRDARGTTSSTWPCSSKNSAV